MPKIRKCFLCSFLRGVIDGDGTVGTAKTGNIWCQFVSASKKFVIEISKILPFSCSVQKPSKGRKTWTLRIAGGNKETISFLRWIYKYKEDLYLERKYAKVQNYINKKSR